MISLAQISEIKKKDLNNDKSIIIENKTKSPFISYTFNSFSTTSKAYSRIISIWNSYKRFHNENYESDEEELEMDESQSTLHDNISLEESNLGNTQDIYFPVLDTTSNHEVAKVIINCKPDEFFENFFQEQKPASYSQFYSNVGYFLISFDEWKTGEDNNTKF